MQSAIIRRLKKPKLFVYTIVLKQCTDDTIKSKEEQLFTIEIVPLTRSFQFQDEIMQIFDPNAKHQLLHCMGGIVPFSAVEESFRLLK